MNTSEIIWTMILGKSVTEHCIGKWVLTVIQPNKLKKLYFPVNVRIQVMIQYILITTLLNKSPFKNILECI